MRDMEDMLRANKTSIEQIEVPEDLEVRLRKALNKKKAPLYQGFKLQAALLMVMITLAALNHDVIASYSKRLFGYDQVMSGTLKELSELGKGQFIGESYTFPDGVSMTMDYVMLDENQLLLFYTVTNPKGDVDRNNISPFMMIKGLWKEYQFTGSSGHMKDDLTEIKYIASFEPPLFFERELTLNFSHEVQGKSVPAEINFNLDRKTALGNTLKKGINQSVQVDETKLEIESILASPTKTVIKGSAQNIFGLAIDTLSGERFRPTDLNLRLMANGMEVNKQGSGISTDMKGITFHSDFDALPSDLRELKLELVSFASDHDVNQEFKLDNRGEQILDILGQKVVVNEIKVTDNETLVKLTSEESLILSKVYLIIDGQRVSLEETVEDEYNKEEGKITHIRTLRFLGTGKELSLDVKRMTYSKNYHHVIEIPLE